VIPVAKLSIEGTGSTYSTPASSNVPGIYIYNTTESTSANTFLALRTTGAGGGDPILSWDIGGVIGWSAGIDNSDGDKFKISNTWSDLTSLTRFTIDGSGKVGIGQTSPNYSLTVNGSIQAGYILLGDTVNGNNSTIEFVTGPNSTSYVPAGGQGNINYYGAGGLTLCYGGGNVMIGTINNTGQKLQVNGTAIFNGSVTASGTGIFGGTNYLVNTSTGTDPVYQRILNTGGDVIFGIASSTGSSLLPGVGNYATVLYNNTNTDISFGTNQIKRLTIASGGNVLPGSNGTQDLGSSTLSWANIYTNDLHLSNETKEGGNDIDGTTGSWTIQEGMENLYLINNKNNKRYFIKLQEIL
jgi:hypothetical protein